MNCLRYSLTVLFVVFGIAAVGCSARTKRSPVSGTVKFKGQPIRLGIISFRSTDDKHVGTGTITDGKYEIQQISGLPAGSYRVAISYPDPKVPAPKGDEAPGEAPPVREMLPAKYANGSELKAEIKDGPNTDVNFDLK